MVKHLPNIQPISDLTKYFFKKSNINFFIYYKSTIFAIKILTNLCKNCECFCYKLKNVRKWKLQPHSALARKLSLGGAEQKSAKKHSKGKQTNGDRLVKRGLKMKQICKHY